MPTSELANQVFAPLRGGQTWHSAQPFLAVPGSGTPRWLIPAQQGRLDSVFETWSPYRLSSRLKWWALRAASGCGHLAALPGSRKVNIYGLGEIDWRRLGWDGAGAPVPLVYLGTPGPTRKAVVHLVEKESGFSRAVVKLPLTTAAKAAILHEAKILAQLTAEGYACAPRTLYVDHSQGIATQSAVDGTPGGRRFKASYWRLLNSLARPGESTTLADQIERMVHRFPVTVARADVPAVAAALGSLSDATPLPVFWVHGDFSPWNLRQMADRTATLLDWEDAEPNGLPLQDAFHFLHMQDYLFAKTPRIHHAALEHFGGTIGLSPSVCRLLELSYITQSFLRRKSLDDHCHAAFLAKSMVLLLNS